MTRPASSKERDNVYKGFREEELEFQYNPRASVSEYPELSRKKSAASREVRSTLRSWLDVSYGKSRREILDIYPARRAGGPVLVYYHGGYWRGGNKEDNCNFAPVFVERGVHVVIVEYDLCPAVTVSDIVRQARTSAAWVYRNIEHYGGDAAKLYVCGHSAGAHLGAMILAHDWQRAGLPRDMIKGAVLTSGVYDLEMVMRIEVNKEIRMTPQLAQDNSPFRHPPLPICPLVVGVGGAEPPGWQRMSQEFFDFCAQRGIESKYLVVPGVNHFTLPEHLGDPESPLAREIFGQMGL